MPDRPNSSALTLAIAGFFFMTAGLGSRPLVPLFARELSIGPGELGVLVAAYAVIPLFIAVRIGQWIDRHGTRRLLIASAAVCCLSIAMLFVLDNRFGLYLSQVISGSAFTAFALAAQNNAGARNPDPAIREKNIAVFSMGVALGSLVGPLAAGFLADALGHAPAFLILGGVGLLSVPILIARVPEVRNPGKRTRSTDESRSPLRVLKYHPYLGRTFLIGALILFGKDIYIAYFPLYAAEIGISASVIGVIVGLHNGGGVVSRFMLLRLVKAVGRSRLIVLSILISGVGFLFIPVLGGVVGLTTLSVLLGLGLGLGQPLSISTAINLSPQDKVGEVLGFRLTCNRLTQVFGPLALGSLAAVAGVSGVFWVVGLVLALGSVKTRIPLDASNDVEH
ncbi:MFS transporter [Saccharospirillum salsuginis]|uniref:MFS transporter n=1 Tax=Saccharospirillum salsuginis TaxID=418750 RepID=A0A918KNW8_9GAMM|nr:MFS transporter [Saccharospirillum salsuginis]GGX68853.1 MFS transporter [Saccharospirillum salsuginis]